MVGPAAAVRRFRWAATSGRGCSASESRLPAPRSWRRSSSAPRLVRLVRLVRAVRAVQGVRAVRAAVAGTRRRKTGRPLLTIRGPRTQGARCVAQCSGRVQCQKGSSVGRALGADAFRGVFEHSIDGCPVRGARRPDSGGNPAACAMLQRSEDEICDWPAGPRRRGRSALGRCGQRGARDRPRPGRTSVSSWRWIALQADVTCGVPTLRRRRSVPV